MPPVWWPDEDHWPDTRLAMLTGTGDFVAFTGEKRRRPV
jgi:hypothetical protein